MTQNDEAWEKIFERLPQIPEVERNGFVYVSADDIKVMSWLRWMVAGMEFEN